MCFRSKQSFLFDLFELGENLKIIRVAGTGDPHVPEPRHRHVGVQALTGPAQQLFSPSSYLVYFSVSRMVGLCLLLCVYEVFRVRNLEYRIFR